MKERERGQQHKPQRRLSVGCLQPLRVGRHTALKDRVKEEKQTNHQLIAGFPRPAAINGCCVVCSLTALRLGRRWFASAEREAAPINHSSQTNLVCLSLMIWLLSLLHQPTLFLVLQLHWLSCCVVCFHCAEHWAVPAPLTHTKENTQLNNQQITLPPLHCSITNQIHDLFFLNTGGAAKAAALLFSSFSSLGRAEMEREKTIADGQAHLVDFHKTSPNKCKQFHLFFNVLITVN